MWVIATNINNELDLINPKTDYIKMYIQCFLETPIDKLIKGYEVNFNFIHNRISKTNYILEYLYKQNRI